MFGKLKEKIEMGFAEKLIAGFIERSCKNYVTTIVGIISVALYALTQFSGVIPPHYQAAVSAASEVLGGVALILAKDAGVKYPTEPSAPTSSKGLSAGLIVLAMLLLPSMAKAQIATIPPVPHPIQNLYALGASYNQGATPQVAGTALYAHLLTDGTYAFTAVDALPASIKPFTVTTNIGIGVAQKLATVGKVDVYVPTAAGISFNGSNTGWEWNAGALAAIKIHGQYYVMPEARFVKASIGGSGYQPIVGLLFAWGQ